MTENTLENHLLHADRDKQHVALSSLIAAILLTGTKLGVGLWTNSLGILSEAAHSGLDLVASGVTFWAVRASGRPADREHTYGHGRIENLSALFETLLLLLTCFWIIAEAVKRLFFAEEISVDPNLWAFLVIFLSIAVDFSRSRALMRAAKKYSSQALEADALHFSTDIWSSLVVLLGLTGVLAAEKFDTPWLAKADAVAALGVAVIVIVVSYRLGKRSVDDLLDSVPVEIYDQLLEAVKRVPDVENVCQLRLRRSGPQFFADLTLTVSHAVAFERVHDIADRVEDTIREILPGADVTVHVEPTSNDSEDITTTVRLLAARYGLGVHGIRIYEERGQHWLEMHVEVCESLLLDEAHRQTTELEQAIRKALPEVTRIVTHIEPVGDSSATTKANRVGQREIQQAIHDFLQQDHYEHAVHPHDVRVQLVGNELSVSFHCTLDATTAITVAHDLTVRLEEYLRRQIAGLGRVVIHVEPDSQHR